MVSLAECVFFTCLAQRLRKVLFVILAICVALTWKLCYHGHLNSKCASIEMEQSDLHIPSVVAEHEVGTHQQLYRLSIQLLHSPLPLEKLEAAYFFLQLDVNVPSVITTAVWLTKARPTLKIIVVNVDNDRLGSPLPNFGAAPLLLEKFHAAGIPRDNIEMVTFDHSGTVHTLNEAEHVVRFVKERGWGSIVVVAPAFHLPRAVMTIASVALREYPRLRVHPLAGGPLPWHERARHSQGMEGLRLDFIDSEFDRILRYTAKGDIASWNELEAYFATCEITEG